MKPFTPRFTAAYASLMSAASAFSHEGHGLSGSHLHWSDFAGLGLLGLLIALALWLSKK